MCNVKGYEDNEYFNNYFLKSGGDNDICLWKVKKV